MAERGQITGGLVDGPLAMDNAVDLEAARTKGIHSTVAGRADVLVAPNLEAGNMLAKQLVFLSQADTGGLVLGAKVPVMLTSRADGEMARLASCALALLASAGGAGRRVETWAGSRRIADARPHPHAQRRLLLPQVRALRPGRSTGLAELARGEVEGLGAAPSLHARGMPPARRWRSAASRPAEMPDHAAALRAVLALLGERFPGAEVRAVGHRVVHGGADFAAPVAVDGSVLAALEGLCPLAPLHQPHNLSGVRRGPGLLPRRAPGRLLRHRLPPPPSLGERRLRPAPRALRRGHPALRIPRPVLRVRGGG
jgi:hypothetical protein